VSAEACATRQEAAVIFETRYSQQWQQWYVVSTPDGHLAHIQREDGRHAAFFSSEEEALDCEAALNRAYAEKGSYDGG
jgi:hypothetical protein